eukprot:scaffold12961_cov56-Cyclotella_meneghiniana.AAC.2
MGIGWGRGAEYSNYPARAFGGSWELTQNTPETARACGGSWELTQIGGPAHYLQKFSHESRKFSAIGENQPAMNF